LSAAGELPDPIGWNKMEGRLIERIDRCLDDSLHDSGGARSLL